MSYENKYVKVENSITKTNDRDGGTNIFEKTIDSLKMKIGNIAATSPSVNADLILQWVRGCR